MARSSRVYTVSWPNMAPHAAFTVKHELVSWLRKQAEPWHFNIVSIPDGGRPGDRVYLSYKELLA